MATATAAQAVARTDEVVVGRMQRFTIVSAALNATVRYRVLVTAEPRPGQRLDLLVLLHGASADEDQWDDVAIDEALLKRQHAGELRPTLLLLPDGDSDNNKGAAAPFARFVLDELVPSVEHRYPVSRLRTHRSVGGISRGGAWALAIAVGAPDQFGTLGLHSAVVPTGVAATDAAHVLARQGTRVWLDVGDGDALRLNVTAFAQRLRAVQARVTFQHHTGSHDRVYWRSQTPAYASFYARD